MPDFHVIPSIEQLRQRAAVRALEARFGAAATLDALRESAALARAAIARGDAELASASAVVTRIESAAADRLAALFQFSLVPVINATGVIVHTNLGRAPLSRAAAARVADIAAGYAALEYDLTRGVRGRRDVHAEALLCRMTGAEAAAVVNNNAAATLLVLAALAAGREVIVSRGELVEIGGGFRVPDVMAQSGATLREVGTTNKTRAADYAAAINERTALILRVHPSNFRIEGFTARPTLAELVALGKQFNIPVAEDLGSGHLRQAESDAGPLAGLIVGRTALVARIRTHPLMRALRVDKMTYAALEATLADYAAGRAPVTIPVQRMLATSANGIRTRAEALAAHIAQRPGWSVQTIAGVSAIGGGSAPGVELPTWLLAIAKAGLTADGLEERLRQLTPAVIGRIDRDRLLLDLRTVLPEQDGQLATLLADV